MFTIVTAFEPYYSKYPITDCSYLVDSNHVVCTYTYDFIERYHSLLHREQFSLRIVVRDRNSPNIVQTSEISTLLRNVTHE